MKLLLAGDTHANLRHTQHLIAVAGEQGCDALVQLGDWGFTWPGFNQLEQLNQSLAKADIFMYFIDGNHDNFDDLIQRGAFGQSTMTLLASHVVYIPRGLIWEWDDCVFMAMGGAFSIDKEGRVEGASWWPQELISYNDLSRAADNLFKELRPIDVFLSHDCPEGVPHLETYLELTSKQFNISYKLDEASRANRHALWQVVEKAKPHWLFHGHYHYPYVNEKCWDGHTMRVVGLDCDGTEKSFTIVDTERLKHD